MARVIRLTNADLLDAIRAFHVRCAQAAHELWDLDTTNLRLVLVKDETPGGTRGRAIIEHDITRIFWWPRMSAAEGLRVVPHEVTHELVPRHNVRFGVRQLALAAAAGVQIPSDAAARVRVAPDGGDAANVADAIVEASITRALVYELIDEGRRLPPA